MADNIPISTSPPTLLTHSSNPTVPECTSFLALSLTPSPTSNNPSPPFFDASKIPLSSKHSLIAPTLYALPSTCLLGDFGSGIVPSEEERFPPGKTCAEGKEEDVRTRWRSRISLVGERRRMLGVLVVMIYRRKGRYLALGRGSAMIFAGLVEEDMYCFSRSGRFCAMIAGITEEGLLVFNADVLTFACGLDVEMERKERILARSSWRIARGCRREQNVDRGRCIELHLNTKRSHRAGYPALTSRGTTACRNLGSRGPLWTPELARVLLTTAAHHAWLTGGLGCRNTKERPASYPKTRDYIFSDNAEPWQLTTYSLLCLLIACKQPRCQIISVPGYINSNRSIPSSFVLFLFL